MQACETPAAAFVAVTCPPSLQRQNERLNEGLAAWAALDDLPASGPAAVDAPRPQPGERAAPQPSATLPVPPSLSRRVAEWLLPGLRRSRERRLRRIRRAMR
jgi:hypothetical protein